MTEPYYFGCVECAGHHLNWRRKDGSLSFTGAGMTRMYWVNTLDGTLCPRDTQEEGVATLTHLHGWSIIAFWDNSVDKRDGSNSMLLVYGYKHFKEVLDRAREAFPEVFKRFDFPIVPHGNVGIARLALRDPVEAADG